MAILGASRTVGSVYCLYAALSSSSIVSAADDELCSTEVVHGVSLLQIGAPTLIAAETPGVAPSNHTVALTAHRRSSGFVGSRDLAAEVHPSQHAMLSLLISDIKNSKCVSMLTSLSERVERLLGSSPPVSRTGRHQEGKPSDPHRGQTTTPAGPNSWSAIRMSLLATFLIGSIVGLLAKRKENFTEEAFKTDEDKLDDAGTRWVVSSEDLISDMGLSGLCFLDLDLNGASGYPLTTVLPCLALQGFTLQAIFLGYLMNTLKPQAHEEGLSTPLAAMIFAAVYVHFVNVSQELIFDLAKIVHLPQLHKKGTHQILVAIICFIDCLLVPGTTLVIGSLFLCTSVTATDLIVNSVGVAFITNIDNFIVEINTASNKLLGTHQEVSIHFPVDIEYVKALNWSICVVPVIPVAFSMLMFYTGKHTMGL